MVLHKFTVDLVLPSTVWLATVAAVVLMVLQCVKGVKRKLSRADGAQNIQGNASTLERGTSLHVHMQKARQNVLDLEPESTGSVQATSMMNENFMLQNPLRKGTVGIEWDPKKNASPIKHTLEPSSQESLDGYLAYRPTKRIPNAIPQNRSKEPPNANGLSEPSPSSTLASEGATLKSQLPISRMDTIRTMRTKDGVTFVHGSVPIESLTDSSAEWDPDRNSMVHKRVMSSVAQQAQVVAPAIVLAAAESPDYLYTKASAAENRHSSIGSGELASAESIGESTLSAEAIEQSGDAAIGDLRSRVDSDASGEYSSFANPKTATLSSTASYEISASSFENLVPTIPTDPGAWLEQLQHSRSEDRDRSERSAELVRQPSDRRDELVRSVRKQAHPMSHSRITKASVAGKGSFGTVYKGSLTDRGLKVPCAIKELHADASDKSRLHFLQEADLMGQLLHPNIVAIIGAVLHEEPICIVMELCDGSLLRLIRMVELDLDQKMRLSQETAAGCAYLHAKNFVHRDLAARNVLVTSAMKPKIADFGLACPLAEDKDYYKSSGGKIPLRWCAPECINFKRYSSASDVWAFAVMLWEVFSQGEVPFAGIPNVILARQVTEGLRLAPPAGTPRRLYALWIKCWAPESDQRVPMPIIEAELQLMIEEGDMEPVSDADALLEQGVTRSESDHTYSGESWGGTTDDPYETPLAGPVESSISVSDPVDPYSEPIDSLRLHPELASAPPFGQSAGFDNPAHLPLPLTDSGDDSMLSLPPPPPSLCGVVQLIPPEMSADDAPAPPLPPRAPPAPPLRQRGLPREE